MQQIEVPKAGIIATIVVAAILLFGGIWWMTGVHHAEGEDHRNIIAQESAEAQNVPKHDDVVRGKPEAGAPQ